MRGLSKSAAALGAATLLLAGGGAFALASSSTRTITVCVHHNGGALYKARKCARHDKMLSWNKQGPPGATGPRGPQGFQGTQGIQGAPGQTGQPGPSDGYFSQPSDVLTAINTTGTDFGALNVAAGSYIVSGTARLNSTGTGSNADCFLRNTAGGNGLLENVNLAASPDRKIISAVWSQAVSTSATFTLRCQITSGDTVGVDEVAIAAIKVASLH